ncbi:MAG: discoidin domain-containing protein [Acidimicrobiia bacterium]
MARPLTLLLTLTLLLGACSSSGTNDTTIHVFSEVQASDFVFMADPTNPARGLFQVTTTEPMICAIVWGETTDYGNFTNSLNMAGTGIVQHDVFLPGAQPGVEYHYIVQGSTADGTLYQSDPGTFTIPATEATSDTVDRGPDLALGATITAVSSEFNDAFAASKAVDGDLTTEWSTAGDGDNASITLDLGQPTHVATIEFLTRSMTDGTAITNTFTVSVDGGQPLGPFSAGNPADPQPASVDVTGTQFAFQVVSSTGGNTGAVEIQMFGS